MIHGISPLGSAPVDVSPREALQTKLLSASEEAEELNRSKSEVRDSDPWGTPKNTEIIGDTEIIVDI